MAAAAAAAIACFALSTAAASAEAAGAEAAPEAAAAAAVEAARCCNSSCCCCCLRCSLRLSFLATEEVGERGALAVAALAAADAGAPALFFVVVALSSLLLLLLPEPLPEPLPPEAPPPKPDPLLELGSAPLPTAESVDAPELSLVVSVFLGAAGAAGSAPSLLLTLKARSSSFQRHEASPPPSIPARVSPRRPPAPRKTDGVSKSKI